MLNKTFPGVVILFCCLLAVRAQESGLSRQDPFQQPSGGIRLEDHFVLAGIATVTRSVGLPLSVEYPLTEKICRFQLAGLFPEARGIPEFHDCR